MVIYINLDPAEIVTKTDLEKIDHPTFATAILSTSTSQLFENVSRSVRLVYANLPVFILINYSLKSIATTVIRYIISLGLLSYVIIKISKRLFKKRTSEIGNKFETISAEIE